MGTPIFKPPDFWKLVPTFTLNVQRLIAAHGANMRLPELKTILANCEKARSFSVYDRCKAKFEVPKGGEL
jgi:hypothetical protein